MSACNAIRRQEDFPFPVARFHNYPHDLVALLNCQLSSELRCLFFSSLLFIFYFFFLGQKVAVFCWMLLLDACSCPVASSTCRAGQLVKCLMS